MRRDEIAEALRHDSFRPFRLYLSDGGTFDIRHSELLMLTRHSAIIGILDRRDNGSSPDAGNGYPDIERTTRVDLIHVTRIEELQGRPV
jgi:hypothetical protein